MKQIYNVYCDESCHLEHDHKSAMTMGAVWCSKSKSQEIFKNIRDIKEKHGLNRNLEIKWKKVSPSKLDFFIELVEYFFNQKDLHFRCLVVPDKTKIDHSRFNQDHNSWYYKIYFSLLKAIFIPECEYHVYIDIKDTNGGGKIDKLHKTLCNSKLDFDREMIKNLQLVKSDEVELVQLADLLIGAMSYASRGLNTSEAKNEIVKKIKEKTGFSLASSTLIREDKFNIFIWQAS